MIKVDFIDEIFGNRITTPRTLDTIMARKIEIWLFAAATLRHDHGWRDLRGLRDPRDGQGLFAGSSGFGAKIQIAPFLIPYAMRIEHHNGDLHFIGKTHG